MIPEQHQQTSAAGRGSSRPSRLTIPFGRRITVYILLAVASAIMALAWLGHLYFKGQLSFQQAMLFSWVLVLPEYALNILALRLGYGRLTGGQMAAFRLSSGVVCVALVSRFVLGEEFTLQRIAGFVLMILAMILISSKNEEVFANNNSGVASKLRTDEVDA